MTKIIITEELRSNIELKIQEVVDRTHNSQEKRIIDSGKERTSIACTYCGDSSGKKYEDLKKKRLNLYWSNLFLHCYNCNKHVSLTQYFKDNKVDFESNNLFAIANYIRENKNEFAKTESLEFSLYSELYNLGVPLEKFLQHTNSYLINDSTFRAAAYIKSRMLKHAYKHFSYDQRSFSLYILNLSNDGKRVIGCQLRNLKEKKKFWTFNIEKIRSICNLQTLVEDSFKLEQFKKLSTIFGILQVDVTRDFTIFEGPFDSLFMNNSIALFGINKETFAFDELPTVRYFLDNDEPGILKSIEKIKKGSRIFLWRKYLSETKLNKYKIKDLNDLVLRINKLDIDDINKKNLFKKIEDYFSQDARDIIWL